MAIQLSVTMRNNRLDQIESTIGTAALLKLVTGAPVADCATTDVGAVCATLTLPSDWMNAASGGTKTLLGTWTQPSAASAGTIGHFRIYDSGGTVCGMQGTVTISGGGGDMTLDNNVVAVGQTVTITTFTLTDGNA